MIILYIVYSIQVYIRESELLPEFIAGRDIDGWM